MHKLSNNCTEYIALVMMMMMVVSRNGMGGCGMDTAGTG